jgi:hypothetical protein
MAMGRRKNECGKRVVDDLMRRLDHNTHETLPPEGRRAVYDTGAAIGGFKVWTMMQMRERR